MKSTSGVTPRLLAYLVADLFGFACLALSVAWFAGARSLFLSNFPGSTAEAVACGAGGLAVMIWAIGKILRELGRQAPAQPD